MLTRESVGTYFTRRTVVLSETEDIVFNLIKGNKKKKERSQRLESKEVLMSSLRPSSTSGSVADA
jgi:hypothetical protein